MGWKITRIFATICLFLYACEVTICTYYLIADGGIINFIAVIVGIFGVFLMTSSLKKSWDK